MNKVALAVVVLCFACDEGSQAPSEGEKPTETAEQDEKPEAKPEPAAKDPKPPSTGREMPREQRNQLTPAAAKQAIKVAMTEMKNKKPNCEPSSATRCPRRDRS